MLVVAFYLGLLGVCLGSFVSALTWRLRNKRDWVGGRSQCPRCSHHLSALDLVPVFSWLFLRGRCRYCRRPISAIYPSLELIMAANFAASYYFWPGGLASSSAKFALVSWLAVSVGLLALAVYDFRWRLLPSKILYPTAIGAIGLKLIYILAFETAKFQSVKLWALSILVASGLFWVLYTVSRGRWIGYGDVRLGFVTGTVLATPSRSVLMIFTASAIGSLSTLPKLAIGSRRLNSQVAFGPYLIIATALVVLLGGPAINWYEHLLSG